jgi:hypothetical protein
MFTTGSKLFLGASTLALAALILLGVTNGGVVGWTATVGLSGAAIALLFLTGVNFYTRDSNVSSMQSDATSTSAAAQDAPGRSFWPIVGALGAGLVVVGLITEPIVFKAGLVVLLAVLVEWMVQAWSERASADPEYNARIRKRLLNPLEFPMLAGLGLSVLIYSFSRIMLFISKSTGPAIFGILAALVLVGGALFAYSPGLKKSVAVGICTITALGLVSTGAVMAIDGQRDIEKHEIIADDSQQVCATNEESEADDNGSQSVAAKASATAIVTLDDGALSAHEMGRTLAVTTITLARANPSNILFKNLDDQTVRLTAHLGEFTTEVNGTSIVERPLTCTTLVEPGGSQQMTLRIPRSSTALPKDVSYSLSVPGLESSPIIIEVP